MTTTIDTPGIAVEQTPDQPAQQVTDQSPSSPVGDVAAYVPTALVERLLAQVTARGGGEEATLAPFTGESLFTYPLASEADVQDAFDRARAAQRAWAARPVRERAEIIGRIHHMALARQSELIDLLQLESGRARYDAFLELTAVAVYSRYASRMAPKLLKRNARKGAIPGVTRASEFRHPKGVVGLVTAWNYPAVFASSDGFAALVSGNAVVHRPDTQTALSALWVRSLAVEAGVPADVWQIVLGAGRVIGTAIIDRADAVAFTGSTRAGREVMARTGPRLVYTSLELGGKNSFIVLPDADVDKAVDAVIRACLVNAGQTCVGPERLVVAREVYGQFRDALVARISELKVAGEMNYGPDMGSLIDAKQLATVTGHVDDAVAKGAVVLAGGRPLPEAGPFFYAPTLLEGVTSEMDVYAEETFGPVLSLYPFDSIDEAVDLANDTEYGLHAVIWSGSTRQAERLATRIKAGTVEVNDSIVATWASADVLQGGMKASGMGRRNGREGILRFTDPQSVVVQRLHGMHPPKSMEKEAFAALTTRSFKMLHKLPRR